MDKMALRKKYLAQRMSMTEKDWQVRSEKICEHLHEFCLKNESVTQVFLFHSIRKEAAVQNLAQKLPKRFQFALPRITEKKMEFCHWDTNTPLVKNSFGIEEPSLNAKIMIANEQTIVLVPNLAMDRKGFRLGYGGGYYDKFLEENANVISIGVNFSEFLVEELVCGLWDKKVKWICTEGGLLRVSV